MTASIAAASRHVERGHLRRAARCRRSPARWRQRCRRARPRRRARPARRASLAIARPIPRDAPVTSATRPARSIIRWRCRSTRRNRRPAQMANAPRPASSSTLTHLDAAIDLLDQSRQHRCPGPARRTSSPRRRSGAGPPPPSAPETTPAGPARRSPRLAVAWAARPRWPRRAPMDARGRQRAQFGRQTILGRLHQRAMERRAHRQRNHPLRAERLRPLAGARDRRGVPGNHDLSGRVEIRRASRLDLRPLPRTRARRPSASRPRIAAIAPSPTGTASCMYRPRRLTVRRASAKDNVPAATCAEYSPRLCPAATAGASPCDARQARDRGAHRENRGLRIFRQRQALLGPVEAQPCSATRQARRPPRQTSRGRSETRRRAPCPCRPSARPDRERRMRS